MPNGSLTLPGVEVRWILEGPAGYMLDTLVAELIGAGAVAECVTATTRYRLRAPATTMATLAQQLAEQAPEYSLAAERAPVERFFRNPATAEADALLKGELPWH